MLTICQSYVLMQLPSNMILTKVGPSIYIPACAMLWSCISSGTAGVHNYPGLIGVRFVLGIAEAPFWPGAFFMLSAWYTCKELALRTAILYSGLVLATALSGLLAAGIFSGLEGVHGLAGWQWLFIIEGAGSFLCFRFHVHPARLPGIQDRQRDLALYRRGATDGCVPHCS